MRNFEQIEKPDFINETTDIAFSIDPEATQWLPEVSVKDLETKIERYRVLLGNWEQQGQRFAVRITSILELQGDPKFYTEGENEVGHVNLALIKKQVEQDQIESKEFEGEHVIGEIHTHPVPKEDLERMELDDAAHPSQGDMDAIISEYKKGTILREEPFIFGIAGPNRLGETVYRFFRLIKTEKGFKAEAL